jgi:hypothetical protein
MPDDKPLTTEEALKKLIKETDRAVAKAQAAMAMVVGTANPEPKATPTVGETMAVGADYSQKLKRPHLRPFTANRTKMCEGHSRSVCRACAMSTG